MGLSVSSCGFDISNTLDFWFGPTRDAKAAKLFLLKTLAASHTTEPRVINVDKKAFAPDGARKRPQSISPGYLDVTVNGEASASMENMLDRHARIIGNELLGIPVRRRRLPPIIRRNKARWTDHHPWSACAWLREAQRQACWETIPRPYSTLKR